MDTNPLEELLQFLKLDTRLDVKAIALDHLLGLSHNNEGIATLLQNQAIIKRVISLIDDKSEEIAKSALFFFVNMTATEIGSKFLVKFSDNSDRLFLDIIIGYVLNPQKSYADAACMILSNITRLDDELDFCIDILFPHLTNILNAFVNLDFNKKGSKLHYLAPTFGNLSRSHRINEWLVKNHEVPLTKILPFCNYNENVIRKGGAVSTIRNLTFATEYHDFLLNTDLDLLTYILNPLMGNEDYSDDEMDTLPIALQYLPKEKERDSDADIRKMLLEILNRLCTNKSCREILRENGVYYVLREYHKWEKDASLLLACENVVDILIRKEEEIGVDDLTTLHVTDDMKSKFVTMDQDFIKNC